MEYRQWVPIVHVGGPWELEPILPRIQRDVDEIMRDKVRECIETETTEEPTT